MQLCFTFGSKMELILSLVFCLVTATALPHDPVIRKLDPGLRYQYAESGDGDLHLVDLWLKLSDLREAARFNPDQDNEFHLFTRDNSAISQPLIMGDNVIESTNYDPQRRTVVLIHGWLESATADFNTVLVPAILTAENVNVIVVDWRVGAGPANYLVAVENTLTSGQGVARFISWLSESTGARLSTFHIIGHGLGGHQAGIVGRNLNGQVSYITGLDPAFAGWITNDNKFQSNDALYTEVIHTNAGLLGYVGNLGQVDFYPNGGIDMPGCISQECDHARSYFYMAESITSGGFTGTRCATFVTAMAGSCFLWGSLRMGGLEPKTGSVGIYHMRTNIFPPFSRG